MLEQKSYSGEADVTSYPPPAVSPATVFGGGRYTSMKVLGKGMFGEAHLVQSSRGLAVLKFIHTSTREERNKALQEAVALAQLPKNSGHLLEVFDFFEEDNGICLIVNHCSGGTVKDLISKGEPVPLTEIARLLYECACGLQLLHESSPPIIHRDIKPDNIFLDSNSRLRIGDFGLARVADNEGSYYAFGCQPYMAPELKFGSMGPSSDMWALGCVAVCLLTGQTMEHRWKYRFSLGSLSPEGISQFLEPILRSVRGLPLEHAVRGLLEYDPKKRLTALEVRRLLGPAGELDLPSKTMMRALEPRSRGWVSRNKKWVCLSVIGALGLGAAVWAFKARAQRTPPVIAAPEPTPIPTVRPPKVAWVHRKPLQVIGQVLGASTVL